MDMNAILTPGTLVMHPQYREWGIGQIQSQIGGKVTVNFPNAGKVVIDCRHVSLELAHS